MSIAKDKKLSAAKTSLRRRAENRLRAKTDESNFPRAKKDEQTLVHELEVHQIELEMQNAELRRAQEELELSHNKYLDLYEFAPVGYFTLDARGLIKEVNLTGTQLLGIDRGLLIKRPFSSFIAEAADRNIFSKHREDVFQKQNKQTCEIRLKKKDGTYFWAQLQSIAQENTKENTDDIRTMIMDITDHKKAAEKIEHLASFPELNPNPVIEADMKGEITYCNAATIKMLKNLNVPEDGRLFFPRNMTDIIKKLGQEKEGQYEIMEMEINGRVFIESIILPRSS